MVFRRESDDVYKALVADLSTTLVPTSIMGVILVGVDLFAWASTDNPYLLIAAIGGGLASVAKLLLILAHLQRDHHSAMTLHDARRWEAMHATATALVALSVGLTGATVFGLPDLPLQMVATALLFGYCAGVVARVAIRPKIALAALLLAAIPTIFAAALYNTGSHHVIAVMFSIFLLGSFETVRHVYRTATRHIVMRLDFAALARYDQLTGLSNRLGLQEAFRNASRHKGNIAIHCLDLDRFKAVNDQFGHAGGDEILVGVAKRLLAVVPINASVARVGGDEFVVFQWDMDHRKEADALARRLVGTLSEPFALAERIVVIGASLGFAVSTATGNLDDLLRLADEASYRIKRNGGGGVGAS